MSPDLTTLHTRALSHAQSSALMGLIRVPLLILNQDGVIQFASEGFSEVIGYKADEYVGKSVLFFLHPNDISAARECLSHLAALGQGKFAQRCRFQGKDGGWHWYQATAQGRSNIPEIEGIVLTFENVTNLQRMESERQVISEIVHALNETANLDELLRGIHLALKKVLYAENCFVALHQPEADSFSFPFFVDQFDEVPPPQKVGRSCTAFVFRAGLPMIITQTEFDRLAARGEVELVGAPSPAWLGVPLKTPTSTIGVLVVQHYENENAYDVRDLEFLNSVGGHIALAIERRRAEDALRKNEEIFRLLFANNPLPTWVFDTETLYFLEVNEAAVREYGYSPNEFKKMTVLDLRPPEEKERFLHYSKNTGNTIRRQGHWKHLRKDGKILQVDTISHELEYGGRRVRMVVAQDVGERRVLEQQLRQSQKMEAIGRLAGGVAHDFNNLLMVIKGHTELLQNGATSPEQFLRKVEQIDKAADRASVLTRQLLAFSRMQVLQPHVMDLNTAVADMGKLLPRMIGEDVELVIRTSGSLGAIRADAGQMGQIVMNLAVNARDAMPEGGQLTIETSNADLDEAYNAVHPIVRPGRYVLLAVSDTGTGMDAETQAHIFEPFFTTKAQGKGTGLGLATVYGVVKQSGGFIWVYSELGRGTTFKIYLPRVDEPVENASSLHLQKEVPRGTGTILLAEDEGDVREVAREFLESGGYKVIEARDGMDALKTVEQEMPGIDLLITDMVMPGMTGLELGARLRAKLPGLRTLYMSGYSEGAVVTAAQNDSTVSMLSKPFNRWALLNAVNDLLKKS
jgi:two-component system, cell cycle sensor histidine kinase and response regulator CckA